MIHNNLVSTPAVANVQPVNHPTQPRLLKLALDVHLAQHVVAMQYDGSSPKPPQRFTPPGLLVWVRKQLAQGWQIHSCYEAGPFGYGLHRQLTALGVTNYVIRPGNWDDDQRRIKTDRTDALSMLNALDRFVAGNTKALALVHVPTPDQERRRTQTRLRQSLVRDLKMIAGRGRGVALQYGWRLKGDWFGRRSWPRWQKQLPPWLIELLLPLRNSALFLHDQIHSLSTQIQSLSTGPLPKGMGPLTQQVLDREATDWHRFKNRRQISSYLGLCPSQNSSGQRQHSGSVTKCGNPRLRWVLVEMAWRLVRFQPDYWRVRKWKNRWLDIRLTPGRRKQALVALARGFGVDWWRIQTGQTTLDKLGLIQGD